MAVPTLRVLLVGRWHADYVGQLRGHCDVRHLTREDHTAPDQGRAHWLLASADIDQRTLDARATALKTRSPMLRIGVMSDDGDLTDTRTADLYVPAHATPADVATALHLARSGFVITDKARAARNCPDAELTERERELLEALCTGLGNDQIARSMHISRRTVEFHLTRIFRKLGVASRLEAIVRAHQ